MITSADRLARRAVLVGFAIQGFTFASLATRLPEIKDEFGLSDYDVLLLLAAVAVASGIGSVLAGWLAERWGSALTLRLGLLLASATVALPSMSPNLTVLVLLTCVYGVFLGSVDAAMNMQGVGVQDRYGRPIMTGFHAMWSAAAVLGAVLASVTIELDLGLVPSMLVVAALGLAANAVGLGTLLERDTLDLPATPGAPVHHVPWLPILVLALPVTAMWLTDAATSVWSGIYLEDGLDAAASTAPIAYAAYQLVLLAVRLVGDRLVARFGPVAVVRASGIVATFAVLLIVVAPGILLVIVGFALLGGGLSLIPPLSYVAAAHLDVEGGSNAVARVNLANYAGYLLAAFSIAWVAEEAGNRLMFVVPLVVIPLLPLMAGRFAARTPSREEALA